MTKVLSKERQEETLPLLKDITPKKGDENPQQPGPAKPTVKTKPVTAIAVAANTETTPMDLLKQAIAGGNVEIAEKMMVLQERWEKNNARKAFDAAMANAKANIPVINKNRKVDFTSAKGRTSYKHEDMAEIARTVDPLLAEQGLSYRYRTSIEGATVTVTCIVSHRLGHFEETTLSAGRDETGNKNSIQAVGSTVTYLQRYTLKAALGLAAAADDDAKTAKKEPEGEPKITAAQESKLVDAIEACGVGRAKFCTHYQIDMVAQLPARLFDEGIKACTDYKAKSAEKK